MLIHGKPRLINASRSQDIDFIFAVRACDIAAYTVHHAPSHAYNIRFAYSTAQRIGFDLPTYAAAVLLHQ